MPRRKAPPPERDQDPSHLLKGCGGFLYAQGAQTETGHTETGTFPRKEGVRMEPFVLDLPMGLGMALAENLPALEAFAALSREEQAQVAAGVQGISSPAEMRAFVQRLTDRKDV